MGQQHTENLATSSNRQRSKSVKEQQARQRSRSPLEDRKTGNEHHRTNKTTGRDKHRDHQKSPSLPETPTKHHRQPRSQYRESSSTSEYREPNATSEYREPSSISDIRGPHSAQVGNIHTTYYGSHSMAGKKEYATHSTRERSWSPIKDQSRHHTKAKPREDDYRIICTQEDTLRQDTALGGREQRSYQDEVEQVKIREVTQHRSQSQYTQPRFTQTKHEIEPECERSRVPQEKFDSRDIITQHHDHTKATHKQGEFWYPPPSKKQREPSEERTTGDEDASQNYTDSYQLDSKSQEGATQRRGPQERTIHRPDHDYNQPNINNRIDLNNRRRNFIIGTSQV